MGTKQIIIIVFFLISAVFAAALLANDSPNPNLIAALLALVAFDCLLAVVLEARQGIGAIGYDERMKTALNRIWRAIWPLIASKDITLESPDQVADYAIPIIEGADSAKRFHSRAWKLMQKRKNFIVIAEDEPYFPEVYSTIREHANRAHSWNDDDERRYRDALARWNEEQGETYGKYPIPGR